MHLKVAPGRIKRGFSSLDELHRDRDEISWFWRVAALFASWMLLGGFLMFPSTFDHDPHLRFSNGVLVGMIAILLVFGYISIAFLCVVVDNSLFHSENLFYPGLCSSALGLLGILYSFVSSARFRLNSAAGAGIGLTSSSAAIFTVLLVLAQQKISRIREGKLYQAALSHQREISVGDSGTERLINGRESQANGHVFPSTNETSYGRESQGSGNLFPSNNDASYYRNYLANMHPTAVHAVSLHARDSTQSLRQIQSPSPPLHTPHNPFQDPSATSAPPPFPHHLRYRSYSHQSLNAQTQYPTSVHTSDSMHNAPATDTIPAPSEVDVPEVDTVNQQMASLLLRTGESQRSTEGSGQTFHIDWPTDDPTSPADQIKLRARSGSGSRLVPPGRILDAQQNQAQSQHKKKDSMTRILMGRIGPFRNNDRLKVIDGDGERGRSNAASAAGYREKSRDERRREIELGSIGAAMAGRQVPRSDDPNRF